MYKPYNTQSGLALILFLTLFLLSSTGILLYRLNNRTGVMLEKQAQTARALAQAKEALIGYAATYAQTHLGQPQGYLPCPDYNGKGSASTCGDAGHSVIGRFPWRTLGLPPLRDGSGECLWYAVSGTYKNNPKRVLADDTDGLFIVQNADDVIIAGNNPANQAIAIIFAPGRPIGGQDRRSTGNATICGKDAIADDAIVDNAIAGNYLDTFTNGINNATGNNTLKEKYSLSANFLVTSLPEDTPTFIQAPLTKQSVNISFNDTLMLITPKDFAPVYEAMNYWVVKQVIQCLEEYGKQYTRDILSQHNTDIANYRTTYETQIQNYLDAHGSPQCEKQCSEVCPDCDVKCKSKCDCQCDKKCQSECETGEPECTVCKSGCEEKCQSDCDDCQSDCEKFKEDHKCDYCKSDCAEPLTTIKKYPWASELGSLPVNHDDNYPDQTNARFGRIPDILINSQNSDNDMSLNWATLNGKPCFNGDGNTVPFEDYEWGWWKEWREEVFFAVDELHQPSAPETYIWVKNNPEETLCTLSQIILGTISNCPIVDNVNNVNLQLNLKRIYLGTAELEQSLVVMVAGKKLAAQERTSHAEKVRIDNYLESNNIPGTGASDTIPSGDEIFISKWAADDFNDAVCGIGEIESSGEITCVSANPPD
jgi:hypothetical protein